MLKELDKTQLNQFDGFFGFIQTDFTKQFLTSRAHTRASLTGNQLGKTGSSMFDLVLRLLNQHPVGWRNFDYYICEDGHDLNFKQAKELEQKCKCGKELELIVGDIRRIRLGSENLPVDTGSMSDGGMSTEGKNTQYPEFKKWLPPFLIKQDISIRKPWMVIKSVTGHPDMMVEFVSYSQTVQSQAGVQLKAAYLDEEPPYEFLEETRPRLIASSGDLNFALTPANRLTYIFDDVFEKAQWIFRTKHVADRMKLRDPLKSDYALTEKTASTKDIAVFQAATDDNPTLTTEQIEKQFDSIDDEDVLDIRRYGLFRQMSGRIYKGFNPRIHVISGEKYFPEGMPFHWVHARGIDYHPHVAWHHGWMSLSPDDEAFIWEELILSPENFTTIEQMRQNAERSQDYKYRLDLIDALANTMQVNTGTTTIEDMNRISRELKRDSIGTGARWRPWDTKSIRGREEIRKRLKNAALCGTPNNNYVKRDGRTERLPTLWIMDNCRRTIEYMQKWRLGEHKGKDVKATKDQNEKPQEKWSHQNMVWEAILKENVFRADVGRQRPSVKTHHNTFAGRV